MKTNKVMEILKANIITDLEKTMFEIFESKCNDYETREEIIKGYENNEFSCINGCISELIYYSDTKEIFKNHFDEILEIVDNFISEAKDGFGKFNVELNSNNLVWFAFELLADRWINEIENRGKLMMVELLEKYKNINGIGVMYINKKIVYIVEWKNNNNLKENFNELEEIENYITENNL